MLVWCVMMDETETQKPTRRTTRATGISVVGGLLLLVGAAVRWWGTAATARDEAYAAGYNIAAGLPAESVGMNPLEITGWVMLAIGVVLILVGLLSWTTSD